MNQQTRPQALATPCVMIEIATPNGNQLITPRAARELHAALTQALAALDQESEQAGSQTGETQSPQTPDDSGAQASDDAPPAEGEAETPAA